MEIYRGRDNIGKAIDTDADAVVDTNMGKEKCRDSLYTYFIFKACPKSKMLEILLWVS